MKYKKIIIALTCLSTPLFADNDRQLQKEIQRLQAQTQALQKQVSLLQKRVSVKAAKTAAKSQPHKKTGKTKSHHKRFMRQSGRGFHTAHVTIHAPEATSSSVGFYPTALVEEGNVITYIAGTPVVSSPYLGDRPAFDGSDYIVNISSINRDIRLMQQRQKLYDTYKSIGYPIPPMPIISISGKVEPMAFINSSFSGNSDADFNLGTSEVDVAAALNENVEGYIAVAYDNTPPEVGPRIDNSAFNLNMGFVNIGNLDKTPLYFTAGQLYVPFGRYSSSMISAPLTMVLARTKTRPFIFGYKSQGVSGPFLAGYGYRSDTTLGRSGVGGANLGYMLKHGDDISEFGVGYISSINDAGGMQNTGSPAGTTFGGFGSLLNGSELVRKTQALNAHANLSYGAVVFAAEWVGAIESFRQQDLSFNGRGARPQAGQLELGYTFRSFDRPSSVGAGYQWSNDALALNLPKQRVSAVYNISIWKDTVESIEYRHDIDYGIYDFANGASAPGFQNFNTVGSGGSSDTVLAQIGVYF